MSYVASFGNLVEFSFTLRPQECLTVSEKRQISDQNFILGGCILQKCYSVYSGNERHGRHTLQIVSQRGLEPIKSTDCSRKKGKQ